MDPYLHGKKALVTGGASGIGRAISIALGEAGAEVAIADRVADARVVAELRQHGVGGHQILADVSSEAGVIKMVRAGLDVLGQIDLYVNCAAGVWPESVTRVSSDRWYRTLDTNLAACVWAGREIARHMIARQAGCILIVGSTVVAAPSYWGTAYRVSKVGLKAYMETQAIELAPFGIRVNMITPGAFNTPLVSGMSTTQRNAVRSEVPFGRREAEPPEIAASAVLLLSDRLSPYTTGADLVVDGGLSLRPIRIGDDDAIRAINTEVSSEE